MTPKDTAHRIANDILDRKGIGNEFEQIDAQIQSEILAYWTELIEEAVAAERDSWKDRIAERNHLIEMLLTLDAIKESRKEIMAKLEAIRGA